VTQLEVFKKAYAVALEIHRVTATFPKPELYGGVADQMRRASKGICANIAEGLGKGGSKVEQSRFLRMSLGSVEELQVWFLFCRDLEYVKPPVYSRWHDGCDQVGRMLAALMARRVERRAA